ncbi:ABC transporter ATP-binding protein [Nonomuraea polychroma]|uniref:ABC transporter ATP-binding protein n=1 Tax=Nonomuraea polychroma TaxID=46176 RepID=UPI003D8CEB5F
MIRRLLALWPGHATMRRLAALYTLTAVLQGGMLALLVPLLRALLAPRPDVAAAAGWLVTLALTGIGYALAVRASMRLGYRTSGVIMRDLQHGIGRHLAGLPLGWFAGTRSGALARTVAQTTMSAAGSASHVWPELLSAIVTPATVVVVTVFVDWRMAAAFAVTVPLALVVLAWTGPIVRRTQTVMESAADEGAARAIEFAQAQPVLRTSGRAHHGYARMEQALDEQRRAFRWALTRHTAPQYAFIGVVQLGFVIALLTGTWLALGGRLQAADAIALLVLASRFVEPLAMIATYFGALRTADVAVDQVAQLMATRPLPEKPTGHTVGDLPGIEFDHVTFAYQDRPVLHEVIFTVPPGTITALIGPSGSGKTTVTRLIARFFDVTAGAVRVGGADVRDLPHAELMKAIAIVFQDVYLFNGTIADNLRLARPDATSDALRSAARAARLDEVIARLPDGWDTLVGEGGTALSGGERQRVAIARALLKDAPIVLLDEATSALDPENEAAVLHGLKALTSDGHRTVLVIAHRLATIAAADQIIVLDEGHVVQTGRHHDLLAQGGRYAELWNQRARARGWRLTSAEQSAHLPLPVTHNDSDTAPFS